MTTTKGIHHITAIAGDAQRNLDFYTKVLGMRLVKKTVNFDDPHTYHFYYGNYEGAPGSILTFFPWANVMQGRKGAGQVTETGFSVPADSLGYWLKRLDDHNVIYNKVASKFGAEYITLLDPDGLKLELTANRDDKRPPFMQGDIEAANAIRGFHSATITLNKLKPTADILTELLGFRLLTNEVNRYRFINDSGTEANLIDLVELPAEQHGLVAGGSVHHIAFRVRNEEEQMILREAIAQKGLNITPQIDRNYFRSLYFREPGGVLFEIATDNPGFAVDEPLGTLGQELKLPEQYEPHRPEIEKALPELK